MNENSYLRIRLSQLPAELEELITSHCFDHGATGVTEALVFSQPDLTYDAKPVETASSDVDVFFTEEPSKDFYDLLTAHSIQWKSYTEENKDWLEEWKKGFEAFRLVGDFWVVPSWLTPPPECKHPIYIDPGMAFGTGTHATTQMMAFFIHKVAQKYSSEINSWKMLDVGTGTAILAMLARLEGMGETVGIEIDPEAQRVARENIALNKLDRIEVPTKQIEEIREKFDLVVANIIDGVLINIKKELMRVLKPGGHMLLTGILEERDNHFFENFLENSGLHVVRRLEKDEWVGYWVQS